MLEVDLFDNPEYYKAALAQEQLKNDYLTSVVKELRTQLEAKDLVIAELQKTCINNLTQISESPLLGAFSFLYDLLQRVRRLEAAFMQTKPTTMNIAGDFVMKKDNK